MPDEFSVCIAIPASGRHMLSVRPRSQAFQYLPVRVGAEAQELAFLPMFGASAFAVSTRKSGTMLRFRELDVEGAELRPSGFADGLVRTRLLGRQSAWELPTRAQLKVDISRLGALSQIAEAKAGLNAGLTDAFGPLSAFAMQNPQVIMGWPQSGDEDCHANQDLAGASIVIALHLTDTATWPEFASHLMQVPEAFRLVITTPLVLPVDIERKIKRQFPNVELLETGAHGGATGAFFDLLYRGAFDDAEFVCRLTDLPVPKAASNLSTVWLRRAGLIALVGSAAAIEGSLARLRDCPNLGMLAATQFLRTTNSVATAAIDPALGRAFKEMAQRLGYSSRVVASDYWASGAFWVRSLALRSLRDLNITDADFRDLPSNVAEAQAAALEMTLSLAVRNGGFAVEAIDAPLPPRSEYIGRDVSVAGWRQIVPLADIAGRRVCLFASYVPAGRFSNAALHYMRALKRCGFLVYVVAAVPDIDAAIEPPETDCVDAFAVRANEGLDFALWASALRRHPQLRDADSLLLANDSVLGPVRPLGDVFARIDAVDADFLGLTENFEIRRHLQSYFLFFKSSALRSQAFGRYWSNVRSLPNKQNLIRAYEVSMLAKLEVEGLRGQALFPLDGGKSKRVVNPTLFHWRELLDRGFPFIKTEVLRDDPGRTDLNGWRAQAGATGFDVEFIAHELAARFPKAVALKAKG
ncbi:MAG: rhamnan synthesis F family protein [Hyphomicrobiaceae bacterium]